MTRVIGRRWFLFEKRAQFEAKTLSVGPGVVEVRAALIGFFVEILVKVEPPRRKIVVTGDVKPPVKDRALTDEEVKDIWK